MNQKTGSAGFRGDLYSSAADAEKGECASAVHDASGAVIDFHSPEFNRTDELNDCSGNYRLFEPLDGIVTSDMRHQMDRRRHQDMVDPCRGDDASPKQK